MLYTYNGVLVNLLHHKWCLFDMLCSNHNSSLCFYRDLVNHTLHMTPQVKFNDYGGHTIATPWPIQLYLNCWSKCSWTSSKKLCGWLSCWNQMTWWTFNCAASNNLPNNCCRTIKYKANVSSDGRLYSPIIWPSTIRFEIFVAQKRYLSGHESPYKS